MSDKLITMKEYNGSSYDTLYPKNISGQVILDSTALNILNLPANSTVNDGFNHLTNGGAFNVGDILVTSRTDMDDTWLLCNGDTFDSAEYPALSNVLPTPSLDNDAMWKSSSKSQTMNGISDGTWPPFYLYQATDLYFITATNSMWSPLYCVNPTSTYSWENAPTVGDSNPTICGITEKDGVIYVINRTSQLFTLDPITLIGTQIENVYAAFIASTNGTIVLSNNYDSNVDGYAWSVLNDDNTTTKILNTSAILYQAYAVGNRLYTINGYVVDINAKTTKKLNVAHDAYDNPMQYYYRDGWYYAHAYKTGELYQSNDGLTFTKRTTVANASMIIVDDKIILGNNIYQMTNSGIKVVNTTKVGNTFSAVITSQEIKYQNKWPILKLDTSSNKLTITTFEPVSKTPTWSPADGLYAYIKAKK